MKYIKRFENIREKDTEIEKFRVGDWVICDDDILFNSGSKKLKIYKEYLHNNIGHIIFINEIYGYFIVKYDTNIPYSIRLNVNSRKIDNNELIFKPINVIEIAKTKKELELKLDANKYNL